MRKKFAKKNTKIVDTDDDSEKFSLLALPPFPTGGKKAWKALNSAPPPTPLSHSARVRSAPIIIHITFSNWIIH